MRLFWTGLYRWQTTRLTEQYGNNRLQLFSAAVLCNILTGFTVIMLITLLFFGFLAPETIEPQARIFFVPLEVFLVTVFISAYIFILNGRYSVGRAIVSFVIVGVTIICVLITGGFPHSVVTPVLVIVPVVVFMLHGSQAGVRMAIIMPLFISAQWLFAELGWLVLPDITSLSSPVINKTLVAVVTYGAVVSVVASYQFQNVLLRKKLAEEQNSLEHQANTDVLTGLRNSRYFYSHLERTIVNVKKDKTRFAILFLDLDGFKKINDSLGHPGGDEVLQIVAKRLQKCVRPGDLVARMGGDEFAVLMTTIDREYAIEDLRDRLRHAITQPIVFDGTEYQVGTSIGSSVYPDVALSAQNLLKSADQAMYRDKLRKLAREMRDVEEAVDVELDGGNVRAA
jgi:diguanylate cyclase (GGDEF)-like protein